MKSKIVLDSARVGPFCLPFRPEIVSLAKVMSVTRVSTNSTGIPHSTLGNTVLSVMLDDVFLLVLFTRNIKNKSLITQQVILSLHVQVRNLYLMCSEMTG